MSVRLQKFLADAGIASRRASEKLIADGHVQVNGEIVRLLGVKVKVSDKVEVDGKPVRAKRKVYVALNKPVGYITTKKDERDRKNIMQLLPEHWQHLNPVGRLDRDTEGLIFLTNDGEFSLRMTHPKYGVVRRYVALVSGRVLGKVAKSICRGITDNGEKLKALSATIHDTNNTHTVVELELNEGRNREVRRLFSAHDHKVEKLKRTQVGKVRLGELPSGKWRTLTDSEIKSLLAGS